MPKKSYSPQKKVARVKMKTQSMAMNCFFLIKKNTQKWIGPLETTKENSNLKNNVKTRTLNILQIYKSNSSPG